MTQTAGRPVDRLTRLTVVNLHLVLYAVIDVLQGVNAWKQVL